MPYQNRDLPKYPIERDMWDELRLTERPIVVYGMGNGADKLFERLASLGVTVADIFASDGFVRGHSFRGMRVKSFSEIVDMYDDFIILLSFASNREEVLDMLTNIDKKYDLYIPDMPVAGVDEYFDKDFYNRNYAEIIRAYDALADDRSRSVLASIIHFKLEGRMSYLEECYSSVDELYSSLPAAQIKSVIDVGAYNGDTLREMKKYFLALTLATAIEPDKKTYKRLLKYVSTEDGFEISPLNVGAWCECRSAVFQSAGNRNSSVSSTASFEHSDLEVELITLDSLGLSPDYIKYDVEGAELEALLGSYVTIESCSPTLLISLYHRSRDIFSLINYVRDNHPNYTLTLHKLRCVPAWEIDLIALPERPRCE